MKLLSQYLLSCIFAIRFFFSTAQAMDNEKLLEEIEMHWCYCYSPNERMLQKKSDNDRKIILQNIMPFLAQNCVNWFRMGQSLKSEKNIECMKWFIRNEREANTSSTWHGETMFEWLMRRPPVFCRVVIDEKIKINSKEVDLSKVFWRGFERFVNGWKFPSDEGCITSEYCRILEFLLESGLDTVKNPVYESYAIDKLLEIKISNVRNRPEEKTYLANLQKMAAIIDCFKIRQTSDNYFKTNMNRHMQDSPFNDAILFAHR